MLAIQKGKAKNKSRMKSSNIAASVIVLSHSFAASGLYGSYGGNILAFLFCSCLILGAYRAIFVACAVCCC